MSFCLPSAYAAGNQAMYDGSYAQWQTLQATVPYPPRFAYGPSWTAPEIATLPESTVGLLIDDTGSVYQTANILDVEASYVHNPATVVNWVAQRLAYFGGNYLACRPTIYMSVAGSYYGSYNSGGSSNVIEALYNAGYIAGVHYDLWLSQSLASAPSSPLYTVTAPSQSPAGWPCVATQWYHTSYDISVVFDATWNAG